MVTRVKNIDSGECPLFTNFSYLIYEEYTCNIDIGEALHSTIYACNNNIIMQIIYNMISKNTCVFPKTHSMQCKLRKILINLSELT